MAKNPKGRDKGQTQKAVAKKTQPKLLLKSANTSKRGRALAILSTVLTVAGLVTLFPRLSASATAPLDLGNQLASSRFTVTNDGYFQVTDVMSACFLWKMVEGGFHATNSLARVVVPPEKRLRPTESLTVPCTSENMIATNPPFVLPLKTADLAVVVYYRVWPFTFLRTHRLFRFVARIGADGTVVWDKQPTPEAMEQDYDDFIQSHGGTFPPTFPTIPPFGPRK